MSYINRRGKPALSFGFGMETDAPACARRAVRRLLQRFDSCTANDVQLVVSELVTNVVTHTGGGGVVRAWVGEHDSSLLVEVEDFSDERPVAADDDRMPGGRGMRIVTEATDEWGVAMTSHGKVVWAEFVRPHEPSLR